jgi:hypothetical protein
MGADWDLSKHIRSVRSQVQRDGQWTRVTIAVTDCWCGAWHAPARLPVASDDTVLEWVRA